MSFYLVQKKCMQIKCISIFMSDISMTNPLIDPQAAFSLMILVPCISCPIGRWHFLFSSLQTGKLVMTESSEPEEWDGKLWVDPETELVTYLEFCSRGRLCRQRIRNLMTAGRVWEVHLSTQPDSPFKTVYIWKLIGSWYFSGHIWTICKT